MSLQERSDLVLTFAQVLHVNGQSTDDTVAAAERLSNSLGLRATIIPRWGELQLQATDGTARLVSLGTASPTGVDMERVASAMRAIDEVGAGQLAPPAVLETITAIAHAPPAPTWLFTLAAAAGAAALSVIFGVQHLAAVTLIVASAAAGAVLRRTLAQYCTNPLLQPLCAALLAGIIGALAVRYQLSSSLRLVAVCPCMILVPGPHVLNGMMDFSVARINLGVSRVAYAGLVILAISSGLLLGLGLLGVSLPVGEPGRAVPLWLRRNRRRRRCGRLQHLLLDALAYVGMAGRRRHAGSCAAMVDTGGGWWRSDRGVRCLSGGRADPRSSRSSSSYALRGHRLCLGGVDDAGRLPVQNGQRPPTTCQ